MAQTTNRDPATLLDPALLGRLKALQLRAVGLVDGVLTGIHKSPHHGSSVEFAEHKEYAHGDEVRHIDWKVFARSDKYYVKRYEQETNLQAVLLVDASASMLYGSAGATATKWDYAMALAAALGYVSLRQMDAIGLVVCDEEVRHWVPPRSRSSHLMHLCDVLVSSTPERGRRTHLHTGVKRLSEVFTRRGHVFVISDLLDPDRAYLPVLKQLESREQHVHLLHVLDPAELSFPFDEVSIFRSLEAPARVLAEPRAMRDAYLREMGRFRDELRAVCFEAGMDYVLCDTSQPLETLLSSMLGPSARAPSRVGRF